MSTLPKAALLAFTVLLCSSPAPAQSPVPPPSSAGMFPLAQVHAGLHGTAYTVFEGNTPEAFGADILGVLHNAEGPGEDLILARLTGAKAEYTGVVAGMSGSPVYIDGKLVGALAFRIGEFSKEPIAGITPIAQMLTVRDLDSTAKPNEAASLPAASDKNLASSAQSSTQVRPIATPLVFSGFSPAALELWKQHAPELGAYGLEPTAGLGGSAQPVAAGASPALEPGSAVSALLVSGDMEIAATCTVTYLDANHLLACGHPLTQFGAVSLPMTKADVVATLASPAGSFKIVNTGETVGAFTQDRQTAIGGLVGATAHMVPVTITIHGVDGATRTLHLQVLDQAQVTPTALLVSIFQALQQTPAYAEENSYRVHATVELAGAAPAEIHTFAAAGGLGTAAISAALTVGLRFNALYSSSDRRTSFTGVQVDITTLGGRRTSALSRVAVEHTPDEPAAIHAGDRLTLEATLAPYRGAPRSVRIPVVLPASLPAGEVRLLVSDGPALDRLLAAGRTAGPTPLASTVAQLNTLHDDDRLYVTLLAPDTEIAVDGRVLASVPPSLANQLLPAHERERGALHGESVVPLASAPVEASFTGEQVLTLRVE